MEKLESMTGDFLIRDGVLIDYCGMKREVVVPEGVTAIGDKAFSIPFYSLYNRSNHPHITSVSLPESVTSIGSRAFEGTDLTSIRFPSGLTGLGSFAFFGCSRLKRVELPAGLTSISEGLFAQCTSLEQVTLPARLTNIPDAMLAECTSLEQVMIPEGVTSIGQRAFAGAGLTSIRLPAGLAELGDWAFSHCARLKHAELPEGITTIPNGLFYGCTNLERVTIPQSVTRIEAMAFTKCERFADAEWLKNVTDAATARRRQALRIAALDAATGKSRDSCRRDEPEPLTQQEKEAVERFLRATFTDAKNMEKHISPTGVYFDREDYAWNNDEDWTVTTSLSLVRISWEEYEKKRCNCDEKQGSSSWRRHILGAWLEEMGVAFFLSGGNAYLEEIPGCDGPLRLCYDQSDDR